MPTLILKTDHLGRQVFDDYVFLGQTKIFDSSDAETGDPTLICITCEPDDANATIYEIPFPNEARQDFDNLPTYIGHMCTDDTFVKELRNKQEIGITCEPRDRETLEIRAGHFVTMFVDGYKFET